MSIRELLHLISIESGTCVLLPTTAARLRQQSFIDGRTDFSVGEPTQRSLRGFVEAEAAPAAPDSYLFHLGFGGSTLLSRLLDFPGSALVLREPDCLAQLANQLAAADRTTDSAARFKAIVGSVRRHLGRPWADGERVVVKPSNWANNLLPHLLENGPPPAVLFLVSSRLAFVRAVIRGGDERIAFTARAAVHLSSCWPEAGEWVADALASETSPMHRLVRLAFVIHAVQVEMFHSASRSNGCTSEHWMDGEELARDPVGAARRAAGVLELDCPPGSIEANASRWLSQDAKDPSRPYSRIDRDARDRELGIQHAGIVEQAMEWAEQHLGPDRSGGPS